MILLRHECKQGRAMLLIWTAVIAFMLAVCILIYPEVKNQMGDIGGMFASMGSFSAAFGLDKLNFGEFIGFFGVECGNVLGIGGAFFAALLGISALAKEEKERTAEFLLTHPIRREQVVLEKLLAVALQIVIMNMVAVGVTMLSVLVIGELPEIKPLALLFAAYLIMQLEIGAICFCISAFLHRGGLGMGLGMAALLYFLNILANLTENAKFLKFITPFGYTDSADILSQGTLNGKYLAVGLALTGAAILGAFWRYRKKDIAS